MKKSLWYTCIEMFHFSLPVTIQPLKQFLCQVSLYRVIPDFLCKWANLEKKEDKEKYTHNFEPISAEDALY